LHNIHFAKLRSTSVAAVTYIYLSLFVKLQGRKVATGHFTRYDQIFFLGPAMMDICPSSYLLSTGERGGEGRGEGDRVVRYLDVGGKGMGIVDVFSGGRGGDGWGG